MMAKTYHPRWRLRIGGFDHFYFTEPPRLYCNEEEFDIEDCSIPSIIDDKKIVEGPENTSLLEADKALRVGKLLTDFNPCPDCYRKSLLVELGE